MPMRVLNGFAMIKYLVHGGANDATHMHQNKGSSLLPLPYACSQVCFETL